MLPSELCESTAVACGFRPSQVTLILQLHGRAAQMNKIDWDRSKYSRGTRAYDIRNAVHAPGYTQYVLDQLDSFYCSRTAYTLVLHECCEERIQPHHVALARSLLDRGADPNLHNSSSAKPLANAARGIGDASVDMVALLLDAHANVRPGSSPLVDVIRGLSTSDSQRHLNCRRIACLLLRAGARISGRVVRMLNDDYPPSWAMGEHYFATKKLILDVRAAGSPQAYRMLRRKQVLLLRSLALKGRAEPRDARMSFLVDSPNEIAWKVLEYWRTELDG